MIKKDKSKILVLGLLLIALAGLFSLKDIAYATTPDPNYYLLAPLPCNPDAIPATPGCDRATKTIETFNPATGLGTYLNLMIKIFIGLCAVLSVVMIVMGGVEYMTSELARTKESGKEKIEHAILGLVIALGAWALLYTINPNLLNSDFSSRLPTATVTVQTWYFETKVVLSGKITNSIHGPYNTQAECQERSASVTANTSPQVTLEKVCFLSDIDR